MVVNHRIDRLWPQSRDTFCCHEIHTLGQSMNKIAKIDSGDDHVRGDDIILNGEHIMNGGDIISGDDIINGDDIISLGEHIISGDDIIILMGVILLPWG